MDAVAPKATMVVYRQALTVAAAGLGGVFIKLLTSDTVRDFLWNLVKTAISGWFG